MQDTPTPQQVYEMTYGGEATDSGLSWRDYLQVIIERFWILLTVFAVVVIAAALRIYRVEPLYKASSQVEIGLRAAKPIESGDVIQRVSLWDRAYVQNQLQILQGQSVVRKAAVALQRQAPETFPVGEENLGSAMREVSGARSAQMIKDTRMVHITATADTPEKAMLIANALAHVATGREALRAAISAGEIIRPCLINTATAATATASGLLCPSSPLSTVQMQRFTDIIMATDRARLPNLVPLVLRYV